jgi:tripartite-type tricarboxylate transporter receptor subunit TctC
MKDFVVISRIAQISFMVLAHPDVPAKNLPELVALLKANPGKYNYASTGNGTGTHMAFAELNAKLGLNMVHVPYKGGPEAMQGVLKGETCCIMNQVQTVLTQYKAGKVRLLGVTTARRVGVIQEVPTIAESGVPGTQNFESTTWFALFAPKGTDPAVAAKMNAAVRQVLQMPEVRAKLEGTGNAVRLETPEQFRVTVKNNRQKWAEVVRAANITID